MPPASANRLAYTFLIFTTLFWGGNAVAGKLAVGHIPPMTLTFSRWVVAFAVIVTIGFPRLKAEWQTVRPYLPRLFAYGAVGFAFFNITLYTAVQYTSAINVAIEQAGMPMLVFLANFILFRIAVRPGQIFGFLLSLVGVATVASHGEIARLLDLSINRGDAIMLLAVLAYGSYTVAIRFKPQIHWQTLMTVMSFAAMITALPFAIWEQQWGGGSMPDARGLAIAAYTAIFPSILAQVFYIRGVELIGSNRTGLFINLVPVFGTLLAITLAGERFHVYHAIAMVLVIGGIWLAERRTAR